METQPGRQSTDANYDIGMRSLLPDLPWSLDGY